MGEQRGHDLLRAGRVLHASGRLDEARDSLDAAVAWYLDRELFTGAASALENLYEVLEGQRRPEDAARKLVEALTLHTRVGDYARFSRTLRRIVSIWDGRHGPIVAMVREGLEISEEATKRLLVAAHGQIVFDDRGPLLLRPFNWLFWKLPGRLFEFVIWRGIRIRKKQEGR